jgi:UDP-GlcNAc:undecaprenyl-phosphate GlcNAc-1-phosphate transferase
VAIACNAVAKPRERDVHSVAIPRMGGLALFAGFALAILVANQLPTLKSTFSDTNGANLHWVLIAAGIICAVGLIDDRYELDSLTKLAGQVLATSVMVTQGGVQLAVIYVPWGHAGTVSLGSDVAIPVTILLTVLTINALNFIDGLDGLAAGVSAIAAIAFFFFAYHLAASGYSQVAAAPTLLAAALAGICVGFLPHNFSPARVFMGDSGSMLIGLLLAAAATTATTSTDPQYLGGLGSFPLLIPLLPLLVLAIPFVDLLLAVVRRLGRGQSPFAPDKRHLHHRMLQIGHSHRRAVLLLYFWSGLLAFGAVATTITRRPAVIGLVIAGLAFIGLLLSLVPRLRARHRPVVEPPPVSPPPRHAVGADRGAP